MKLDAKKPLSIAKQSMTNMWGSQGDDNHWDIYERILQPTVGVVIHLGATENDTG